MLRCISGGQTGADRAFLEIAKELGFPTGGFVPKGWLTEGGPDPSLAEFGCVEHWSDKYPPRTKANVRAADGTVWFGNTKSAGFKCTEKAAKGYKPWIVNPTAYALELFIKDHCIHMLNGAGNRMSKNPAVYKLVMNTMREVLTSLSKKEFTLAP